MFSRTALGVDLLHRSRKVGGLREADSDCRWAAVPCSCVGWIEGSTTLGWLLKLMIVCAVVTMAI